MRDADELIIRAVKAGTDLLNSPEQAPADNRGTTVFVHGFIGWGEKDDLNRLVPYWGLACGDMLSYLRSFGYKCRAASVGPLSSAWDRACELYAQLTGSRTDYGCAHSNAFGHSRWGIDYSEALVPDWSDVNPIDLVGHSFGGATIRLFLDILENGRPEEIEACERECTEPSPFFKGGKGSWVHSVSAIAAPHNGTTLIDSSSELTKAVVMLFTAFAKTAGISDYKDVYDFQLDQFGIYKAPNETLSDAVARILGADFLSKGDHALNDLSVDNSLALNRSINIQKYIYYFSYPCCLTHQALANYDQLPDITMTPILRNYAISMGSFTGTTAAGKSINRQWHPNDGLVNTVSAMYPSGDSFSVYSGSKEIQPGTWNIMPIKRFDHFAAIGGVFNVSTQEMKRFYLEIMKNIDGTYSTAENK